jgi:hypothetical protein
VSVLTGTVTAGGVPLASGVIYVFTHATGTYTGNDPVIAAGAFAVNLPDDTYGLFVDPASPPPAGGHVGGGTPPASTPIVVAGDTSVEIAHDGTVWQVVPSTVPPPAISRTMQDRARILAALKAGGVRTATTGKMSAPVVLVEPGEPWSEPRRLPGRVTRWKLTAYAGGADSEGAFSKLGDLIDDVDLALRALPGCELPTWSKPADDSVGGVPVSGSVATVQYSSI